ncbi:MAG: hypothetical protein KAJ12_03775 [Bacteroidetes bacterium]|nr:hypothetical protein [Bacteroidota bacterium]
MGSKRREKISPSPSGDETAVPNQTEEQLSPPVTEQRTRNRGSVVGGVVLIALGLIFLAENFFPRFNVWDYWPLILIIIGAGLLWKSRW